MASNKEDLFDKAKLSSLDSNDLSKKGSVDEPIVDLIAYINSLPNFFTTSSCSGRIIVFAEENPLQKQGCLWLLTKHLACTPTEVLENADPKKGNLTFKYEPFVLHVQCRSVDDAQSLLSCGVQAGFRNSGISLKARKNKSQEWPKIMVAIRSTHGLEVPLSSENELLVNEKYIEHITLKANSLMEENFKRISRFFENVKEKFPVVNNETRNT